jgi:hypothetical protein
MDLRALYPTLEYPVELDGAPIVLRIGEPSPEMDHALAQRGVASAAYLTAWNPGGRVLPRGENDARQRALVASLGDLEVVPAPGGWIPGAPDPRGEREESVLVLGIDEDRATRLADAHGQLAYVLAVRGEPVRLVWCAAAR